jgi:hypothetical protein
MKASKFFMIGVSVTALIFGMTVVSCGGGGGAFTLTNIPSEYDGMYAFLEADLYNPDYARLLGAQKINVEAEENTTLVKISNGKVSIPMWVETDSEKFVRYSGNDKAELEVHIYDSATLDNRIAKVYFDSVVFSKGNATKSVHDGNFDSW